MVINCTYLSLAGSWCVLCHELFAPNIRKYHFRKKESIIVSLLLDQSPPQSRRCMIPMKITLFSHTITISRNTGFTCIRLASETIYYMRVNQIIVTSLMFGKTLMASRMGSDDDLGQPRSNTSDVILTY